MCLCVCYGLYMYIDTKTTSGSTGFFYYKFCSALTGISYFLLYIYIWNNDSLLTFHTFSAQLPFVSGSISLYLVSYIKKFK